jgi:heme-degrading monooxygenase HmoA
MSRRWLGLPVLLAGAVLSGCSIATPFRGPETDSRNDLEVTTETVHVALTHAVVHDDRALRSEFWSQVDRIVAVLPEQPGFVGDSRRRNLTGSEAWTMTVWTDAASADRFVAHETHVTAMRTSGETLAAFRSARLDLPREDIPISWSRALELLDQQGSGYPANRRP